jgi:hypothetical protein
MLLGLYIKMTFLIREDVVFTKGTDVRVRNVSLGINQLQRDTELLVFLQDFVEKCLKTGAGLTRCSL